jgi:hypothetical protein
MVIDMLYRHPEIKKEPKPKKLTPEEEARIFKYWLVEFTLTSGRILQFYVSGKTMFDAQEKALAYECWVEDETLRSKLKTFRLMP